MLQQKDIRKVLLAGAGVMGSSFAQIFAKHGYEVILYDIAERSLEKARGVISVNQEAEVASGELTAEESAALVERITIQRVFFPGRFCFGVHCGEHGTAPRFLARGV